MDETLVVTSRNNDILTVTLNRPSKSNSLNPELVSLLTSCFESSAADLSLKVVVITGAGKTFCAGLDLDLLLSWSIEEKLDHLDKVTSLYSLIWNLPQPVIAAVNGPAIAGGFDLAAFCDVRLAASEAVFGQAEINIGLTQIIHPLYKTIGLAHAKEMALTGRSITSEEACRIGLVNHVYPSNELMRRAMEMAETMASKPRTALFDTKRLTRTLIDLDTAAAMETIRSSFRRCLESEEHQRSVAAVFEKLKKGR